MNTTRRFYGQKNNFLLGHATQKLLGVGMKVAAHYAFLVNVCLCLAGVYS